MLVLHERKLKYQSIKTEHYHTNIFFLQKLGGAVSGIVWVDAIKVKCIMLRQNYSFAKLIWFYSLAQQLETSNQPSPRGHLFVTQTIPDILAQHSNGAQSPKCFTSGTWRGTFMSGFQILWVYSQGKKSGWTEDEGHGSEVCHVLGCESMSHVLSHFRRLISAEERATWPYVKGL